MNQLYVKIIHPYRIIDGKPTKIDTHPGWYPEDKEDMLREKISVEHGRNARNEFQFNECFGLKFEVRYVPVMDDFTIKYPKGYTRDI